jgi:hypothetical protein
MSASYCFVLHVRCIAHRVRDSIFAEHPRPQVAAFMECADFMQPRWPSRISTFESLIEFPKSRAPRLPKATTACWRLGELAEGNEFVAFAIWGGERLDYCIG